MLSFMSHLCKQLVHMISDLPCGCYNMRKNRLIFNMVVIVVVVIYEKSRLIAVVVMCELNRLIINH